MNIFLILGIVGGLGLGATLVYTASKNNKKEQSSKLSLKDIIAKESTTSESSTPASTHSNAQSSNANSPSSKYNQTTVPQTQSSSSSSAQNLNSNTSAQSSMSDDLNKLNSNLKIREEAVESIILTDINKLQEINKNIDKIKEKFLKFDATISSADFYNNMTNASHYSDISNELNAIKKDFKTLQEQAVNLNLNAIEVNKLNEDILKQIHNASKIQQNLKNHFTDKEFEHITEIAEGITHEDNEWVMAIHVFRDSVKKCFSDMQELDEAAISLFEGRINQTNDAFFNTPNGSYFTRLKGNHFANLETKYHEMVNEYAHILELMNKLKNISLMRK